MMMMMMVVMRRMDGSRKKGFDGGFGGGEDSVGLVGLGSLGEGGGGVSFLLSSSLLLLLLLLFIFPFGGLIWVECELDILSYRLWRGVLSNEFVVEWVTFFETTY